MKTEYFLSTITDPFDAIPANEIIISRKKNIPNTYEMAMTILSSRPLDEWIRPLQEHSLIISGSWEDCLECLFINGWLAFRVGQTVYAHQPGVVIGKGGKYIKEYARLTGRKNLKVVSIDKASCALIASVMTKPLVKQLAEWVLWERCEKASKAIGGYFARTLFEDEVVYMKRTLPNHKIEVEKEDGQKIEVWPDELSDWGVRF